jgi:hypothetical protein
LRITGKILKMNSLKIKRTSAFIFYPKCWIKNKLTGEVRWFEALGRNAEDAAAMHWAFFDSRDKMQNLGSSFFDTKSNDSLDNAQIYKQQMAYLLEVAIKINKNTGVKEDPYNNITFEYLMSIFLGTSFGNNTNKSSDLPGVIWSYGGSDFITKKLPYTLVKGSVFTFDLFMSSQNAGLGSDVASNDRARAINYFETKTKSYIGNETLFKIKQHTF